MTAGRGDQEPRAPAARPRFTGRAAILAVVLAAVALSLAYPVREYIAQRRQIDQLRAQGQRIAVQVKRLQAQRRDLSRPGYIERLARDRLHMCLPSQMCYVIVPSSSHGGKAGARRQAGAPWYARLWSSVQEADSVPPGGTAGRRTRRAGSGGTGSGGTGSGGTGSGGTGTGGATGAPP